MTLKTLVKVSVNNLSDARYCAGMGVDFIGFNLAENGIDETSYHAITQWLEGCKFVGEFTNESSDYILKKLESHQFSAIQTNFPTAFEHPTISSTFLKIEDVVLNNSFIEKINTYPENSYFLLSSKETGLLSREEITTLNQISNNHAVFLGFGFDDTNLLKILSETKIKGISMNGSDEIRPGFKDFDELATILELLEIEA